MITLLQNKVRIVRIMFKFKKFRFVTSTVWYSLYSSVSTVTAGEPVFDSRQVQGFLSSPPRLERLRGSSILLPNGYEGLLSRG